MNKVFLLGRLGKDPEVKFLQSGTAVATVSLATNDRFQKDGEWKETTEWHTVKVWGKQAEWLANARQGDSLFVEGTLKTESWEASDGTKKYRTYVNARGEIKVIPKGAARASVDGEPVVKPIPDDDIPF